MPADSHESTCLSSADFFLRDCFLLSSLLRPPIASAAGEDPARSDPKPCFKDFDFQVSPRTTPSSTTGSL